MSENSTDEQQGDAVKVRRPRGAPQLAPYPAMNRRMRAQFWTALGPVMEAQEILDQVAGGDLPPRLAGAFMQMVADVEDALRILAIEQDAFDAWAEKADDDALLTLLNWYTDRFQVGEARASSAS